MFPPPASTLASPIAKTTGAQVVDSRQGRLPSMYLTLRGHAICVKGNALISSARQ